MNILFFGFFNPHPRMYLGRKGGREGGRERGIDVRGDIDWLPPVGALTGD